MSYSELMSVQVGPKTYSKSEYVAHVFMDGTVHHLQIDKIFDLDGDTWIQYHYVESHIKSSGDDGNNKMILSATRFAEIFKLSY